MKETKQASQSKNQSGSSGQSQTQKTTKDYKSDDKFRKDSTQSTVKNSDKQSSSKDQDDV